MNFFATPHGDDAAMKTISRLFGRAAFALLPNWAQGVYGINASWPLHTRTGVKTVLTVLRASAGEPPFIAQARHRLVSVRLAQPCQALSASAT
jgi:hypothetical protein